MPVEFLSDNQVRSYGRYAGEPTAAQLARFFYLDDADRELLADRRGDHNRLGLACRLSPQILGTFLSDPTEVPAAVVASVAAQLGIPGNTGLSLYRERLVGITLPSFANAMATRDFGEQPEHFKLVLTPLDALPLPPSLIALRTQVAQRLPRTDIPDPILEIHARTGFADAFTHISERTARVEDLAISICAVLIAEACNIGLVPLVRPDVPALTRGRLLWVQQNYVRAETIALANAWLVEAQSKIALAQAWGDGEVATADGLRFVVPVRTLNAAPNPMYFGRGHGATYFNFANNQFAGLGGVVVPGTLKDGPYLLAGLL